MARDKRTVYSALPVPLAVERRLSALGLRDRDEVARMIGQGLEAMTPFLNDGVCRVLIERNGGGFTITAALGD